MDRQTFVIQYATARARLDAAIETLVAEYDAPEIVERLAEANKIKDADVRLLRLTEIQADLLEFIAGGDAAEEDSDEQEASPDARIATAKKTKPVVRRKAKKG